MIQSTHFKSASPILLEPHSAGQFHSFQAAEHLQKPPPIPGKELPPLKYSAQRKPSADALPPEIEGLFSGTENKRPPSYKIGAVLCACAPKKFVFGFAFLSQQVLVLNRLWQAVNALGTARRALTLLFEGHAQAVLGANDGSFQTYDFSEWRIFPSNNRIREHPYGPFKIRVPE